MRLAIAATAAALVGGCTVLTSFDSPAESGEQCHDMVDNDDNGAMDCDEASCASECQIDRCAVFPGDLHAHDTETDHCYVGFNAPLDARSAGNACFALGGYLAVPDDAAEDALIRTAAPPSATLGIEQRLPSSNYDFRLITGDRGLDYMNFTPGQPDEPTDAMMICVSYDGAAPTWQDHDCSLARPYVCEVTPAPCGDDVTQGPEICDDGNTEATDGCSPACTDEDECILGTNNCDVNADCFNQPWTRTSPGFTCECRPGFSGDGVTCVPS